MSQTIRKQLVIKIAAYLFHEDWRKTRKRKDGTFEPRWKVVKDKNFIETLKEKGFQNSIRVNKNIVEQDIANTTFENLSADWKAENKAAAEVVADLVLSENNLDKHEIGVKIHTAWLKRNLWAKGNPKLDVPFEKLPRKEKNKDLRQYKIGRKIYKNMLKQKKNG